MRLLPRQLGQTGDTIIEVLIAIAIISSVLVGAYALTNRSTASTQDAQERSQAVQLVEGQIENLRDLVSTGGTLPTGTFCFAADGSTTQGTDCVMSPNGPNTEPAYTMAISHVADVYTIGAVWTGIMGNGQNNVTMYYRPPTP
jgi:type II secretory pathway pseudopilin PulG